MATIIFYCWKCGARHELSETGWTAILCSVCKTELQHPRLLTPRAPDPAATEAIVQDIMTEAETYLASEDYDDFERFLHERLGG